MARPAPGLPGPGAGPGRRSQDPARGQDAPVPAPTSTSSPRSSAQSSSQQLSLSEHSLAQLNAANEKAMSVAARRAEKAQKEAERERRRDQAQRRRQQRQQQPREQQPRPPQRSKRYRLVPAADGDGLRKVSSGDEYEDVRRSKTKATKTRTRRKKDRVVSGPTLEKGGGGGGGGGDDGPGGYDGADANRSRGGRAHRRRPPADPAKGRMSRRKMIVVAVGLLALLLVVLIPVGVLVIGKKHGASVRSGSSSDGNLRGVSPSDIPAAAKGSMLDPFTWLDTTDYNVTYTNATVGDLPIMGLNSTWDDHRRANEHVPWLDEAWPYGQRPIRGVNVGGWLSLEPFITPSLFEGYDSKLGIIDEWTLTQHLGPAAAAQALEAHYAAFVTAQTFADIAAAGLDHVRIPFPYWAVTTYGGEPYVGQMAWRYLLRGLEWARAHGLRVNLDLHALPGSQNGWNHSGRQGAVGWLNGTEGAVNGQRALALHDRLSRFFAQARYARLVTIYGLVNEPKMSSLPLDTVMAWTGQAIALVQANGLRATLAVADGFLGLPHWHGLLASHANLVLDAHQYIIFNDGQLALPHAQKLDFACAGWSAQMLQSVDPATGFGPTLCGEWSQADTDCAPFLNDVHVGNRWTGSLTPLDPAAAAITHPVCAAAAAGAACSCDIPNAAPDPTTHLVPGYPPAYARWLRAFAEAQMLSFEHGWGWFYWTWDTERAVQWSWKKGVLAGILPPDPANRSFTCADGAAAAVAWDGLAEGY
ncbi:MAG: hypothetical protein M1826_003444 [Phylliscum demangeonii]|nr:MAG: hypothetical protein M1826_003444 [Phylliscum demangeonii]